MSQGLASGGRVVGSLARSGEVGQLSAGLLVLVLDLLSDGAYGCKSDKVSLQYHDE